MLNFMGVNSTVYEINSVLVFGVCVLWHVYCSMSGMMYQLGYQYFRDVLPFGLLWITTLVPGGDIGVRL